MTLNKEDETLLDRKELEQLDHYLVKYPDEQMIRATIDTLRPYVPQKSEASPSKVTRFLEIFKRMKIEVRFIHPIFWIMSIALFVLGYLVTSQLDYNPTLVLIILAPLPFIFGLIEVFRGRDANLIEMELACKFSAFEVILTRLLIVSLFNFGLVLVLALTLATANQQVNLFEMLVVWFGPFTFFIAIALFLSIKFRGVLFVPIFLSIWIIFSLSIVSENVWQERLLTFNVPFHLMLIAVGSSLAIIQMRSLFKQFDRYQEVGTIETSY